MTDRERSFLASIIANPADDQPRLIFADALEAGDGGFPADPERAEFIRVQCELAMRHTYAGPWERQSQWSPELVERMSYLRDRERWLLQYAWQNWQGVCVEVIRKGSRIPSCIQFHRGFIEQLTCAWSDFASHADAIREQTPLRAVTLTTWPEVEVSIYGLRLQGSQQMSEYPRHLSIENMLSAEYPGITFTLPGDDSLRMESIFGDGPVVLLPQGAVYRSLH